ncbi:MAG: polyprenyl diphosphate synthase [Candidatus Diapherotrites archaeon]
MKSVNLNSVAFIPDGNRRYAFARNVSLAEAYLMGTKRTWDVFDWMKKYPETKFITFYTLSQENLSRSREELGVLFKIFEKELNKAISRRNLFGEGVKVNFVGKKDFFPQKIQVKMNELSELTQDNKERIISFAIGYNGQEEIINAAKLLSEKVKSGEILSEEITLDLFKKHLYYGFPEPDLIVRTSGTQRLSGFLTYQSAYSELLFLKKYWPEINEQDIDSIVNDFDSRERRFGK